MEYTDRLLSFIKSLFPYKRSAHESFPELFMHFQEILENNNRAMEVMTDMNDKLSGQYVFDGKYLEDSVAEIEKTILKSAYNFNYITRNKYYDIYSVIEALGRELKMELSGNLVIPGGRVVLGLSDIRERMDEAVGNKAYNLSRVFHLPRINVPKSFVVSINGFQRFMAFNNLYERVETLLADYEKGTSAEEVSRNIQLLILNGEVSSDLGKEIRKAAEDIFPGKSESGHYSVRSSAVGEDGALSFAGLHDSFLHVPYRELLPAYKKVVAGMYSSISLEYRKNRQIPMTEMAMGVLFQEMVPCRISGVVYTVDPESPQEQVSVIGANWGLGKAVVESSVSVDTFRVSRDSAHAVIEKRIQKKEWMMGAGESVPGTRIDPEIAELPCLTDEQASRIVESALIIERFFKYPMDIEWCLDENDTLKILQARPLALHRGGQARGPELSALLKKHTVLLQDQGVIAYRGVGSGPVWIFEDKGDLDRFPSGAVLVARYGIPLLSRVIPRASAVITDIGSTTGHMATVAREFKIPTIVDTGSASKVLEPGREITVDAEQNTVYLGKINELLHHQLLEQQLFEIKYEFQILRRLLRRISPLTLLDPEDPAFSIRECKTFHDIIRFIHEKSIQTLMKIAQKPSDFISRGGKRLKSELPLNLILIDIGAGIDPGAQGGWVVPEDIRSLPMKALWEGLSSENLWSTNPVQADFKGLMSGVTRTQQSMVAGQTVSGLNAAILDRHYMNLTLRVGYHFTVVDAMMDTDREKNSILFRFVGGAADMSRRSRRATLIAFILEKIGFKVEGGGDLVIARAVNIGIDRVKTRLYLIGKLIGFVRQLDVMMTDDSTVELFFSRFVKENIMPEENNQTLHKEKFK